ncbi:PIG-P-domain-containing protein [Cryphonectria parasitica EP155]|uniref:PIG-P-domain-containing protein n=1 Tax=Cryphonectria parasitica (strain ATCC 38755 / EP155) TaxID=660469 RepID=A0A9P4Y1R1_CRYP1|nr:PIG-P-domain-containing protein [Cryphonectria parasitica EP155]KAF3764565.1 PIG-P-domain-containing protein [Cryphonectria parasitica EP155]
MLSFGPPYYGRPPTPLPPSPSLTSLLRPSRPTTPDASDDEGLNSAEPVPRASPKVPTYEYYGFVLYLFSSCCFLMYLLWSYLPSPFLHALGVHYYPDRWWSLAVPSFLVVLLAYIYVALALYNTEYLTLPLHSLETIVDEAGKIAVVDGRGRIREREDARGARGVGGGGGGGGRHHLRKGSGNGFALREREVDWRGCWNEGTDAVMDVPLAGVCEILYRRGSMDGDGSIKDA